MLQMNDVMTTTVASAGPNSLIEEVLDHDRAKVRQRERLCVAFLLTRQVECVDRKPRLQFERRRPETERIQFLLDGDPDLLAPRIEISRSGWRTVGRPNLRSQLSGAFIGIHAPQVMAWCKRNKQSISSQTVLKTPRTSTHFFKCRGCAAESRWRRFQNLSNS